MRPRRVVARAAKHRHGRLMVARRRSRWSAALMVFGALAVTFVGLRAFGVTTIGWAVAFAISSWALVTSSTECVKSPLLA